MTAFLPGRIADRVANKKVSLASNRRRTVGGRFGAIGCGGSFRPTGYTSFLDKALRIYAWFLLVVTALPAAARLVKPRELARIILLRYQNPKRRKRARIGGIVYLGLSAMAIPFFWLSQYRQQRWLIMALLVGVVSALEFVLDSRLEDEDVLSRQNRYFGGVYAAMAIAVALLLLTTR